jgi:flagellum-specific peptidoglycan hydrolase FlgJ
MQKRAIMAFMGLNGAFFLTGCMDKKAIVLDLGDAGMMAQAAGAMPLDQAADVAQAPLAAPAAQPVQDALQANLAPALPATGSTTATSPTPATGAVPATAVAAMNAPGAGLPTTSGSVDTSALDRWRGGRLPAREFVAMMRPIALEAQRVTGVPAGVIIAQAALESGYGASTIRNARNLFGMKGSGPAGSVTARTREVVRGQSVYVNARFRAYNTWLESVIDHARLLSTNPRYARAMAVRNDPRAFAREVQRAGYATDPNYANSLIRIMDEHQLSGGTPA